MTEQDTSDSDSVLAEGSYASIAINDGNEPYIITLNYGWYNKDRTLYFCTEKSGMKLDFLKSNSFVCGTVIVERDRKVETDRVVYESCVFRGIMEVIHSKPEQEKALSTFRITPDLVNMRNPMILRLEVEDLEKRKRDLPRLCE